MTLVNFKSLGRTALMAGCAVTLFALPACTQALIETAKYGIFTTEDSKMRIRNIAAADYMNQTLSGYADETNLIRATPLHERLEPAISSQLGEIIAEQIGTRLSQIGYSVDLRGVSSADTTAYLAPGSDIANQSPAFILGGSYMQQDQKLQISARITDAKTGKAVAVFDYSLPLTHEIHDLSRAKPRIFKR